MLCRLMSYDTLCDVITLALVFWQRVLVAKAVNFPRLTLLVRK